MSVHRIVMALSTKSVVYHERPEQYADIQEIQSSIATIRNFVEKAPSKSSLSLRIPRLILPQVYQAVSAAACQVYLDLETENLNVTMAPTAVHISARSTCYAPALTPADNRKDLALKSSFQLWPFSYLPVRMRLCGGQTTISPLTCLSL